MKRVDILGDGTAPKELEVAARCRWLTPVVAYAALFAARGGMVPFDAALAAFLGLTSWRLPLVAKGIVSGLDFVYRRPCSPR